LSAHPPSQGHDLTHSLHCSVKCTPTHPRARFHTFIALLRQAYTHPAKGTISHIHSAALSSAHPPSQGHDLTHSSHCSVERTPTQPPAQFHNQPKQNTTMLKTQAFIAPLCKEHPSSQGHDFTTKQYKTQQRGDQREIHTFVMPLRAARLNQGTEPQTTNTQYKTQHRGDQYGVHTFFPHVVACKSTPESEHRTTNNEYTNTQARIKRRAQAANTQDRVRANNKHTNTQAHIKRRAQAAKTQDSVRANNKHTNTQARIKRRAQAANTEQDREILRLTKARPSTMPRMIFSCCVSCAYASISVALSVAVPAMMRPMLIPAASPATCVCACVYVFVCLCVCQCQP